MMPQATEDLRVLFKDDGEAYDVLSHGNWHYDWAEHVWRHPDHREPTQQELDAASYLHDEWDFGWFVKR